MFCCGISCGSGTNTALLIPTSAHTHTHTLIPSLHRLLNKHSRCYPKHLIHYITHTHTHIHKHTLGRDMAETDFSTALRTLGVLESFFGGTHTHTHTKTHTTTTHTHTH